MAFNKQHTKESKEKMRQKALGNKRTLGRHWRWTDEQKTKIVGRKLSLDARRKVSLAMKGNKNGFQEENKLFLGKKHTEEAREKMRLAQKGEKNHNWIDGRSHILYPVEWTSTLRLAIRQRDNFTCQKCGITEEEHLKKLKRVLSVNHIDFDKNNCDPKNLNTLCVSCNTSINSNREYWKEYFLKKQYA